MHPACVRALGMMGLACVLMAGDTTGGGIIAGAQADQTKAPQGKIIGLVLSGYSFNFYETPDGKEECPDGLAYSSRDNWEAQFPAIQARRAHLEQCSLVDNRGPDCASTYAVPDLIKDPLPFREVKGSKAYGLNLDGTDDGRATANTCAHRKFVGVDGTRGVDNQFYRLYGCHRGLRGGNKEDEKQIAQAISLRVLWEIHGVDDKRNDDKVEVVMYRGKDPLIVDANDHAVPWQTQRVEESIPPLRMKARIVDGMLITERVDAPRWHGDRFFLDSVQLLSAGFNVRLTEEGAEGLQTGYFDINEIWEARRSVATAAFGDSLPSLYAALHRLADGHKDKNGVCTSLSTAAGVTFVPAYIRHAGKI